MTVSGKGGRPKKGEEKYRKYWDYPGSPFKSETAWWTWLRGSIRRIWSRSPVKIAYKQSRRYKAPVGRNAKEVWVSDCELCGKQCRDCEVDHIEGGTGFTDWTSFKQWQERILLVSFDDIRELCPECHGLVTYMQKTGLSFEEARAEKRAIELQKTKKDVQFLESVGIVPGKNATIRRKQLVEYFMKESGGE